jgi:myo-inositol-1(or 4)-monophosphatase
MIESTDETLLETARAAAWAGGKILLDWRGKFRVREKAPADLVTDADFAAQRAIQELIGTRHPAHGFLGEENVDLTGEDPRFRWIVDPLDGTVNYAHAVPGYCVSVALEVDGELRVGVIFDPNANETFSAVAGQGAFLNDEPIHASDVTDLKQAMMVASFAAGVTRESLEITNFVEVLVQSQSLRRTGSAALNLSYVAAGRFDGYWATDNKAWDIAAGWLIVKEAGGVICPLPGAELSIDRPKFIAAATPELAQQLSKILVLPPR